MFILLLLTRGYQHFSLQRDLLPELRSHRQQVWGSQVHLGRPRTASTGGSSPRSPPRWRTAAGSVPRASPRGRRSPGTLRRDSAAGTGTSDWTEPWLRDAESPVVRFRRDSYVSILSCATSRRTKQEVEWGLEEITIIWPIDAINHAANSKKSISRVYNKIKEL